MLNKELIRFIVEDQIEDEAIVKKLCIGLKTIEQTLTNLNLYIVGCVPALFEEKAISKIEEYSNISDCIKQDIESIQEQLIEIQSFFSESKNKIEKPSDEANEASELHILDINTKLCCEEKLEDKYTMVYIFDKDGAIEKSKNIWTKHCHVCNRHYVYSDMAAVLVRSFGDKIHIQGQAQNAQPHNETTGEEQTICKYHACNDSVYRDGYCKYHYSYEHYTSK